MPVFKSKFYPWVPNIADGGMGLMGLMGVGCGMCGFDGFCFDFLLWVLVHLQVHGGGGGGCNGGGRDGFIVVEVATVWVGLRWHLGLWAFGSNFDGVWIRFNGIWVA